MPLTSYESSDKLYSIATCEGKNYDLDHLMRVQERKI